MTATNTVSLILQHDNTANGVMRIKISNLNDITSDVRYDNCQFEFNLSYQFHLNEDVKYYQNNTWSSSKFTILNIATDNHFFLRLPLFLLSYSLEYKLIITTTDYDTSHTTSTFSSSNYTANIPSIIMESSFKKGDIIDYDECVKQNASFITKGTVLEILENDIIKIKNSKNGNIIKVHSSDVYRPTIFNAFVIDITNRNRSDINLILNTNNRECFEIYDALLLNLHSVIIHEWDPVIDEMNQLKATNRFISINICDFLYNRQYNYNIQCIFDETYFDIEQTWKYVLLNDYKQIKKQCNLESIQSIRDCLGYSCNICRVNMNWSDYIFYCNCSKRHDVCISCVHSLMLQHNAMKPFISKLLIDKLNANCIEEIVSFCVAKMNTFYINNKSNRKEERKKCNDNIYPPKKRRKLH
eukprot:18590_1